MRCVHICLFAEQFLKDIQMTPFTSRFHDRLLNFQGVHLLIIIKCQFFWSTSTKLKFITRSYVHSYDVHIANKLKRNSFKNNLFFKIPKYAYCTFFTLFDFINSNFLKSIYALYFTRMCKSMRHENQSRHS